MGILKRQESGPDHIGQVPHHGQRCPGYIRENPWRDVALLGISSTLRIKSWYRSIRNCQRRKSQTGSKLWSRECIRQHRCRSWRDKACKWCLLDIWITCLCMFESVMTTSFQRKLASNGLDGLGTSRNLTTTRPLRAPACRTQY